PEPMEVEGELEYEVEKIEDSRTYRNQFQYLVKWKGYDEGQNSWEPAKDCHGRAPHSAHDTLCLPFSNRTDRDPPPLSANNTSESAVPPLQAHQRSVQRPFPAAPRCLPCAASRQHPCSWCSV
ncbi:hypothetical protein BD311DRAFT_679396, partial [Dichomitus squalens]